VFIVHQAHITISVSLDPEIDRVEQNDRSAAIYARLDDQLDFRRIFRLSSTWLQLGSTVIDSIDLAVSPLHWKRGGSRGGELPSPDSPRPAVAAPKATAPLAPCYAFTVKRDPHDVQPHAGGDCPWAFTAKKDPRNAQPHAVAGSVS